MTKVNGFPGFPSAVTQLMEVLEDPNASLSRIEEILKLDPGMTTNVLKLSNSAYFGFPSRVGSVRKAVTLLGARRLKQLVLASCINAVMDRSIPGYELPTGKLWYHSIAVSVTAEGLAKELGIKEQGEIFTAALLHDIGKLVLGAFVSSELEEIEKRVATGVSFDAAEREVLGIDHGEIGAILLEKWAFPEELVHAVRWHHEPDRSDRRHPVTDIVHAANVLCTMIGIGMGRDGLQHEISPATTHRLGLRPQLIETMASKALLWITETAQALQMGDGN